jgi:hypothetical protein
MDALSFILGVVVGVCGVFALEPLVNFARDTWKRIQSRNEIQ